jgi:hypothetical protein
MIREAGRRFGRPKQCKAVVRIIGVLQGTKLQEGLWQKVERVTHGLSALVSSSVLSASM